MDLLERRRKIANVLAGLALALALVAAGRVVADSTEPSQPEPSQPMQLPHGQKDIAAAPSGRYTLDPNHVTRPMRLMAVWKANSH